MLLPGGARKNVVWADDSSIFQPCFYNNVIVSGLFWQEFGIEGYPSKEKLFGQSALLMNAAYIVF